jgi:hypothetical protein
MVDDPKLRANRLAAADVTQRVLRCRFLGNRPKQVVEVRQNESESTQGLIWRRLLSPKWKHEKPKTTTKYVYSFGGGKADGGKMKDVLGGRARGWLR